MEPDRRLIHNQPLLKTVFLKCDATSKPHGESYPVCFTFIFKKNTPLATSTTKGENAERTNEIIGIRNVPRKLERRQLKHNENVYRN